MDLQVVRRVGKDHIYGLCWQLVHDLHTVARQYLV